MSAAGTRLWMTGSKDQSISFLLANARHRFPARAHKGCRIPGGFAFAGSIGLRGRTVAPAAVIFEGSVITKCIGDIDGHQNKKD
jgi:hypothetical protein